MLTDDFGAVADDCLDLRKHIPADRLAAYDRLTHLALRAAVLPAVDELRDDRPLAPVVDLFTLAKEITAL